MTRHPLLLAFLVALCALAAGCTMTTQESRAPEDDGQERILAVDVPPGATQLRVDTTATAQAGQPDVTVLVKDEAGNILGTRTWALKDRAQDTLTVDVRGQARLVVVAKVLDGDASLDVRVTALVPDAPEVVVVHQTFVITQAPTTPPASSTPTPSTPGPTPTTTSTPTSTTPTPTPPTPTTPPTNATNNTTTTNTTPP